MTRRVIEGTPGNLRVVRLAQLPFNFDHSYFRYVRFLGRSNAARSARYLDVVDSEVAADLTNVDMTGVESFHSDWRGATMTEAQVENLCNYDITRGFMWQESKDYLDANTTLGQAAKDAILEAFPPDADRRSWKRMFARWMSVTGYTAAQVRQHLVALYGPRTRIFQNYQARVGNDDNVPRLLTVRGIERKLVKVPFAEWSGEMKDAVSANNRWALARAAEVAADAWYGGPFRAFAWSIFPNIYVEVEPDIGPSPFYPDFPPEVL